MENETNIKIPRINLKTPTTVKPQSGFFEPVPDQVRVRDVLREVPSALAETGKYLLRAAPRAAASVTLSAIGQKELKPETSAEKLLYGEMPVKSLGQREKGASETLQGFGLSAGTAGAIAPFAVIGSTLLDVLPGGGFRRKAFSAAEDAVKIIAQSSRAGDIYDIVKSEIKGISEARAVKISEQLARETNPNRVALKLNNEIRFTETGKFKPAAKEQVEIPKEPAPPQELAPLRAERVSEIPPKTATPTAEEALATLSEKAAREATPTLNEMQLDDLAKSEARLTAAETEGRLVGEHVANPAEEPSFRPLAEVLKSKEELRFRREAELQSMRDTLDAHPAKKLVKYADRRTGELPEVRGVSPALGRATGESVARSVFGQRGDSIVKELGYEDVEAAKNSLREYKALQRQEQELTREVFSKERAISAELKDARFEENRLREVEVRPTRTDITPLEQAYDEHRAFVKANRTLLQRITNQAREFFKAPSKREFIAQQIRKTKSEDPLLSHLLKAGTSRLKDINPSLKRILRDADDSIEQWIIRAHRNSGDWYGALKEIHGKSFDDYADLRYALARRDRVKTMDIGVKYNKGDIFKKMFQGLGEMFREGKDAGIEIQFLEDFFPLRVVDAPGFMDYVRTKFGSKLENWSFFNQALQREAERLGRTKGLTPPEQADIVNRLLMGRRVNGISVREIGVIPHRTIDVITPEMMQFYASPEQALDIYFRNMAEKIVWSRTLGLKGADGKAGEIMGTMGARILSLKSEKGLTPEQEMEILRTLQARIKERGTHGAISTFKNITYTSVLSNPFSAIRQIGDFGNGMYLARSDYLAAWVKAVLGKSELQAKDVLSGYWSNAVSGITTEFRDYSRLARFLSNMLKVTGFEKMDTIGKEALMNGVIARYRRMALKGEIPKGMQFRLDQWFGKDNVEQVIQDLRTGKITENVRMLGINALADVQPIFLSDNSVGYLTAGNGKIFYMLKAWQIRQLNFYRDEIKDQFTHNPKGAIYNLMSLAAFLMVANASADVIIDTILGRDIDPGDLVVDNILRLGGANRYLINKARQEGAGAAVEDLIFPPTNIIDNIVRDANRFFKGETEKGFETPQNIPLLGKFYYWRYGRGHTKEIAKHKKAGGGIAIPNIKIPGIKVPSIKIPSIRI